MPLSDFLWLARLRQGLGRLRRDPARLVSKPAFWAVAIAILLGWPIVRAVRQTLPPRLPVLGTLAEFKLRDQTGRDYGSDELRGKVWIGNVISTRCPTLCPAVTERMSKVQHRARNLGASFRLVSFSRGPEHDSPEVLAEYAKKHRASPRLWSFLTGDRAPIDEPEHGRLVLVDQRLQIRGYYITEDDRVIDRLLRDVGLLTALGAAR